MDGETDVEIIEADVLKANSSTKKIIGRHSWDRGEDSGPNSS